MFDFAANDGPKPKCFFTKTKLSNYLNHEQPPRKKKPYSTVLGQTFSHTLDILLPTPSAKTLLSHLSSTQTGTLKYHRVHFKPLALLSEPLFSSLKSESKPLLLISQNLTISSGLLQIQTDKSTFERLGLPGKAIPSEGRKHVKARYLVEVNFRLPNFVPGKSGFERVKGAFKNVLEESVTWLVCGAEGELEEFQPVLREREAEVQEMQGVLVPSMQGEVDEDEAVELLEWLGLAMMGSPRIRKDDDFDAFLSRYQVPGETTTQDLTRLRWRGLIPPEFAYKIFLAALKASGEGWLAISATSFTNETYTILIHDGHASSWEYKD